MPNARLAPPVATSVPALRHAGFRLVPTAVCLSLMLLVGCSAIPNTPPPRLEVPEQFKEGVAFTRVHPEAVTVPDAWWTLFNDPVLNDLQTRLAQGNATLAASAAAVRVAQAAVGTARVGLLPALGVSGGVVRSASGSADPTTTYTAQGAFASWEIDVWGRVGAGVAAADARYLASRHTLAATQLSLQATLAQSYFSLRAAEALGLLLDQTVAAYQRSLDLTQNRYQGGVASAADVAQAQTQLRSAQTQRAEARLQRAQLEHAIAALLGLPPAAFGLDGSGCDHEGVLPLPPQAPLQVPSTLLTRRPDIAAAAAQVVAANAQIGAAEAAFFPALTLSASAGLRSGDWRDLLSLGNRFWSIGPSLLWAAFDGGARRAASDSARASYDQAVANWRQTALTALQEVEDNLIAATALQEEEGLQRDSRASARRALDIAENQYKAGTVSYLNVVSAQTTLLGVERSLLDARNRRLAAVNQLLKNLAGRW